MSARESHGRAARALLAAALLAALVVGGCWRSSQDAATEGDEEGRPTQASPLPGGVAETGPDVFRLDVPEGETPPPAVAFAWADRKIITVGEVLTLNVAVNHAVGVQVAFPTFRRMNRFEVLPGGQDESEPTPDGRIVSRHVYLLQAFMPGDDYRIPAVPITYLDSNGKNRRIRTKPIQVIAASVIPEGAEPVDVIDIKREKAGEIPLPVWMVPAAIGAIVVLAALLTFLIFRLRRRAPQRRRPLEPHEIALAELAALRERGLLKEGRYGEHYVELSLVFRRYLTRRFGWNALRAASEEIGTQLTQSPYLGEHTFEVADRFMGETDKVKFAAHAPAPPESDGTWNDITYFIDLTRTMTPTVEAEGEAEGEGAS